jgi:drug/metabolite transporter (DMT)-like permease
VIIAYIILCSIFGTTFLAVKSGINAGFAPFMFAGLRFLIAGLVLVSYTGIRGMLRGLGKQDWLQVGLIGLAMTTGKFAALYWAMQYISSGSSALLVAIFPIMVVIASYLIQRDRITGLQRLGLLLGFAGVYLIVDMRVAGNGWIVGAAAIMAGEFINAMGAVYSRQVLNRGISPVVLNGVQMLVGSIGLIVLSLLWETAPLPSLDPRLGWLAMWYLVVAGSIIGAGIYYWLIKMMGPLIPSTWSYVSPVIALVVGMVVLNETVTTRSWFGAAVVLTGVVLTNYEAFSGLWRMKMHAEQE